MTREELLAKAKAKQEREALLERARAKMNGTPTNDQTVEEMPDWLKTTDRMVAKNLANSTEAQAKYIQQQYPNAQVQVKDDRVYMRNQGEPWKALDPNTGFFSKDFLNDVGDLAYDIPAGIAQTAATTTAGALGGIATLPSGGVGAVPAAMAASGASGAGLEALRQKLGQALGIPQEINGKQVAITGGISALTPALFGAGNITKVAPNVTSLAEQEVLRQAQRGLIGRGVDAVAPKFSTVGQGAIDWYTKNGQKGLDAINDNEYGLTSDLTKMSGQINDIRKGIIKKAGEPIDDLYRNASGEIDYSRSLKAYQDRINQLQSKGNLVGADEGELNSLIAQRDNLFKFNYGNQKISEINPLTLAKDKKPEFQTTRSPYDLWSLRKKVDDSIDYAHQGKQSYVEWLNNSTAKDARNLMNEALDESLPEAKLLRQNYETAVNMGESLSPFSNVQKLNSALGNIDTNSNRMFRDKTSRILMNNGVDVKGLADKVQAFDAFNDPTWLGKNLKYQVQGNTLGDITGDIGAAGASKIDPSYSFITAAKAATKAAGNIVAGPKSTKAIIDYSKKQYAPFYLNQNSATLPFLEYMLNEKANSQP